MYGALYKDVIPTYQSILAITIIVPYFANLVNNFM